MSGSADIDELIALYQEGELTTEQERRLAEQLKSTPESLQDARGLLAMDYHLRTLFDNRYDAVHFRRAFDERLHAQRDGVSFRTQVLHRHQQSTRSKHDNGSRRRWRRIRIGFSLASAATLAAIVGVWFWNAEHGTGSGEVVARVAAVGGMVDGLPAEALSGVEGAKAGPWLMVDGEKKSAVLKVGDEVREGARIETGAHGSVTLAWVDGPTKLELGANSSFDTRQSTRVFLHRGRLEAAVAKQDPARPFVVETPNALATVMGTRFTLTVSGEGREQHDGSMFRRPQASSPVTWLEVQAGQVQLAKSGGSPAILVTDGYCAVAASGIDLVAAPIESASLPASEAGVRLLHFDFENGRGSPEWTGRIVRGPARAGSRFCLEGRYVPKDRLTRALIADGTKGLFTYRDGTVLIFDYWVEEGVLAIDVNVWDRTRQLSIPAQPMFDLKRKEWVRVRLPLAEFSRQGDKRLHDGDLITEITIQTGRPSGKLFVDNIMCGLPDLEPRE